jgi:serine/threonine protein kinase
VDFLPDMIGDGAMKQVYFTADRKSVLCFYKDPKAGSEPERLYRLAAILGPNNPTIPRSAGGAAKNEADAKYFSNLFCWPTAIVTKPRFGIMTPVYPSTFFFTGGPDFIRGKEKNGKWFSSPKLRKLLPATELGDFRSYFSLCVQMGRAVARLHNAGLAHSDLSPNNVLIDPTRGTSLVIDVDSLVVEGKYAPDVAGTQGFIAPEVLVTLRLPPRDPQRKYPNARTDIHALAVLIYQYLLRRHPLEGRRIPKSYDPDEQDRMIYGSEALFCEHPTDTSNRPEENSYIGCPALGPLLNDLFQRTFVKGLHTPNLRPSALEWLGGLVKSWDLLLPCANGSCTHKWFILGDPKNVKCPFCGTKPATEVPVLKLRSEWKPGQWQQDSQVAVYHNLTLFRWHVYRNEYPGPDADRTPQAYCVLHQGQWLLINQNLPTLTSPGGNPVPAGQAVVLKHGDTFRLGTEENVRSIEVEILRP